MKKPLPAIERCCEAEAGLSLSAVAHGASRFEPAASATLGDCRERKSPASGSYRGAGATTYALCSASRAQR